MADSYCYIPELSIIVIFHCVVIYWYRSMIFQNGKYTVLNSHVSFILDTGGRPHTECPHARLIGVIKQMTFQEIPLRDSYPQIEN